MIWKIMQMEKGVAEVDNSFRVLHNTAALCHIYPANKASFCLLEWGGEKRVLPESPQTFYVTAARTSGLVNLVFFCLTFFFECEHPFIDKSPSITEPAVPSARILGLGTKLYPSSMQRMLNKDLTWFTQSLFRVRRKQAGERKALDDRPPPPPPYVNFWIRHWYKAECNDCFIIHLKNIFTFLTSLAPRRLASHADESACDLQLIFAHNGKGIYLSVQQTFVRQERVTNP